MLALKIAIVAVPILVSAASSAFATSIFAVRTPTTMVIGADSKSGTPTAPGTLPARCKIGEMNSVVWAVAGSTENADLNLSIHAEARASLAGPEGFFDRLKNFRERAGFKLGQLYGTWAKYERDTFLKYIYGKGITEIIFGAEDRGQMRMVVLKYYSKEGDETQIFSDTEIYPKIDGREATNWVEIGTRTVRQASVDDDPELLNRGEETAIRRFLEVAAEKHPTIVGPPISLIRIKKGKIEWVEKGACPG